MSMLSFLRRVVAFLIASLVASWMLADRGSAHGEPAALVFWGNFGTATARCQRTIGHAASLCSLRAAQARAWCHRQDIRDAPCDPAHVDTAVQAARSHARAVVRRQCNAQQVQLLRYLDINEALTDVIGICRELDTRLTQFAFAPWLGDRESIRSDPDAIACIAATSAAATRLLRKALGSHRKALDRIAAKNIAFGRKQQLIARSRAHVAQAVAKTAAASSVPCPMSKFIELYGVAPGERFAALADEVECFGGAIYVQDEVVCPPR